MAVLSSSPLTLKILRQELAGLLRTLTLGTVDSATTTTFTDADLIDSGESETLYDRAWVKLNGEVRRVVPAGYDMADGTITVGRAFTSVPSAGDAYEIHKFVSPDELDECINQALVSLWYDREQVIPIVADQTDYDLADYEWITNQDQVISVAVRIGDVSGEYRYADLPWWEIKRTNADENTASAMPYEHMYLYTRPLSDTDAALVIRGMATYEALTGDTMATAAPYDWVIASAEWRVYDLQMRDSPSTDRKIYEEKRKDAGYRLAVLNRRYMPRPRLRIKHPDYTYYNYSPLNLQDES